jgi:hypothetical protein
MIGTLNRELNPWRIATGKQIAILRGQQIPVTTHAEPGFERSLRSAAFSPDGSRIGPSRMKLAE